MLCPYNRSTMILDNPNCYGHIQIVLVRSKLVWTVQNHFEPIEGH